MRNRLRPLRWSAAALTVLVATGAGLLVAPAPASAETVREAQWYLDTLRVPEAHETTRGRGVTVAVVDSGIHAAHPDLRGQVLAGRGFGPGAARDGRRDVSDNGHGTSMAGLIAGRGAGANSLLGIAPQARILPVGTPERARQADLAAGIRWAADNGADVISLSVGGSDAAEDELAEAVRYAQGKDVVLVAAAGNRADGSTTVVAPANIPGVVAVAGVDRRGRPSAESVTGREVAVSAPLERILSIGPPDHVPSGYGFIGGTSSATAIVAGVVALIRAAHPDLDAPNVINRLVRTARDEGPAGRDPEYGFGVVNPVAAVRRDVPPVDSNPLLATVADDDPRPDPGGSGDEPGPPLSIGLADGVGGLQLALYLLAALAVVAVVVVLVVVNRRARRRAVAAPADSPPAGYLGPQPPVAPYPHAPPAGHPPASYPYAPPPGPGGQPPSWPAAAPPPPPGSDPYPR
ncbi:S8 family serine peptidase [Micromonospora fluostatini]|uniref:S8 family serine peptidase n=1 Tax=Micromonospora sp. JCM 30529 TaxID=3421643 RepID=UPI003D1751C0